MALALRQPLSLTIKSTPVQFKRFRGKINIQKPKPPHFRKAVILELAKPWFINPKRDKKPIELCTGPYGLKESKKEEDNPFQRILAKELREWFEKSKLIAFYHRNSMNAEEDFNAYAKFKQKNMHYKQYGKKTMEMAIKESKYETILDFYVSQNMTVFSPEGNIKDLLKISKRVPQIVLLAAIYEGRLISKDELMQLSLIPNLQSAQAGLVQVLDRIGGQLVNHLNSHQSALVSNLEQRMKQLEIDQKSDN